MQLRKPEIGDAFHNQGKSPGVVISETHAVYLDVDSLDRLMVVRGSAPDLGWIIDIPGEFGFIPHRKVQDAIRAIRVAIGLNEDGTTPKDDQFYHPEH